MVVYVIEHNLITWPKKLCKLCNYYAIKITYLLTFYYGYSYKNKTNVEEEQDSVHI